MKNIFKFSLIAATTAISLVSCSKSEETAVSEGTLSHTVIIHATEAVSKTIITEGVSSATFKWSSDDASRFYLLENTVAGSAIAISSSDSYETISLSATFATESAAEYTYSGFLAKNQTGSHKPRVPVAQTSTASTYDPNADVLVAKSLTFATTQDELEMQFHRPVAISKMTLKGLTEGETVSKVTISSDIKFTGYYDTSADSWTADGDEITITTSQVVPASGQIVVWFTSIPVDGATLTVVAETEDYTYSKTFASTIDLSLNEVTRFGVSSLTKEAKTDYSGYYLIGCLNSSYWQLMDSEINTSGSNHYYPKYTSNVGTDAASVDFSEFSGIANIDQYLWKVEAYDGAYSIKSVASGNYLSYSGSANAAQSVAELGASAKFSITLAASTATIESCNVSGRVLKYNSNSPRFAFYTSGQSDIFMIPATYDDRTAVTLSFAEDALDYDTDDYGDCTGQAATASPNVSAIIDNITYALTGDAIGTVNPSTGAVTLNGSTGTATITASFAGDATYRAAQKSYTITVSTAGSATLQYTLTPASGSNNSYASDCDIEIDGITWNLTGNSTVQPWRLGGKSLTNVDRALYSKTAISANISQIVITHGTASSITVNSMTVTVSKNSDFSDPVSTLTPSFVASGTVTVDRPDGKDWSNCYYKITYNVSVSGSSNKFIQFTGAEFYGTN